MQVQKINNQQTFGMAMKKPTPTVKNFLAEIFGEDTKLAGDLKDTFEKFQADQKNNPFYDTELRKGTVGGGADDGSCFETWSDDVLKLSIIDKKSSNVVDSIVLYSTENPSKEALLKNLSQANEEIKVKTAAKENLTATKQIVESL